MNMNSLPKDERGYYIIASAEALNGFAQLVEQGQTNICGVLSNDIDFRGYPATMIGNSKTYGGIFDGAGHTITIGLVREADYAGLFGHLSGTVKDLIVRGTIRTSGKYAGMVSEMFGGTLLRCQSYIDIIATISGDGTHGGLAGLISEASNISQLQDCIFAGSIEGTEVNSCGGLVGWATATGFISNCLMMGNMNISSDGGDVICRNNSRAILQDTYYISDWGAEIPYDAKSADQQSARSGELCYLLNAGRKDGNQAWFQTLNIIIAAAIVSLSGAAFDTLR